MIAVDTLALLRGRVPSARSLPTRLLAVLAAAHGVGALLTTLIGPPLLLLAEGETERLRATAAWGAAALFVVSTVQVLAARGKMRPVLEEAFRGATAPEPALIAFIYKQPMRLAAVAAGGATFVALASWAASTVSADGGTQASASLLNLTLTATTPLPAYVLMRAQVTRIIEVMPPAAARDALELLGPSSRGRVGLRFLAAVAAPVAVIALGASLLVVAHGRASDRKARAEALRDVALAAMAHTDDGPLGSEAARERASKLAIELSEATPGLADEEWSFTASDGLVSVRAPLGSGHVAIARSEPPDLPTSVAALVVLAVAGALLAGLLGARIGQAFDRDLNQARRQLRTTGVAEAMRGSLFHESARFALVDELFRAVDQLGARFHTFSMAQTRATHAKASAERMRSLLLASMSHDLKGPLNAILGFAAIAQRSVRHEAQRESLAIIEERGRELLVLIDTILDSARAEAGELDLNRVPCSLEGCVRDAVARAEALLGETSVVIRTEVAPHLPRLLADSERLAQAFAAVISTASRFARRGAVTVRASLESDATARIDIETRGDVLPPEERMKVFDAFQSAHSARKHGSLGLGLSLARAIVALHDGTLSVEGTAEDALLLRARIPLRGGGRRSHAAPPIDGARGSLGTMTEVMIWPPRHDD